MNLLLKFITGVEREDLNEHNINFEGYYDNFEPGTIYYAPWLHDPEDIIRTKNYVYRWKKSIQHTGQYKYLSDHYWTQWATKRSPIIIILPDRRQWVIDSRATNGPGWTIKFDDGKIPGEDNRNPKITAQPSIQTPDYHGWLTKGVLIPC